MRCQFDAARCTTLPNGRLAPDFAFAPVSAFSCLAPAAESVNPMTRSYVARLYRRKAPFDTLDDERFHILVRLSMDNPRLHFSDDTRDGPDFHQMDISRGIFELLETVPTTIHWLWTLDSLLTNYLPKYCWGEENVLQVIERWRSVNMKKYQSDEDDSGNLTELKIGEEFGCRLAAVFGRYLKGKNWQCVGAADSEDIVMRSAYYGTSSDMKVQDMQAAFDKDGSVFTLAALHNWSFYRNRACRAHLESLLSGYQSSLYNVYCQKMAEREKNFDPKPVSDDYFKEDDPNEKVDPIAKINESILKLEGRLQSIQKDASSTKSLMYWAIGLTALVLWHMK